MFNNEDRISRVFEGHHVFITGGKKRNVFKKELPCNAGFLSVKCVAFWN